VFVVVVDLIEIFDASSFCVLSNDLILSEAVESRLVVVVAAAAVRWNSVAPDVGYVQSMPKVTVPAAAAAAAAVVRSSDWVKMAEWHLWSLRGTAKLHRVAPVVVVAAAAGRTDQVSQPVRRPDSRMCSQEDHHRTTDQAWQPSPSFPRQHPLHTSADCRRQCLVLLNFRVVSDQRNRRRHPACQADDAVACTEQNWVAVPSSASPTDRRYHIQPLDHPVPSAAAAAVADSIHTPTQVRDAIRPVSDCVGAD
jgi:hypothetical protein